MDERFRVEVISQTPNPQRTIYAALHQDYSEQFVNDELMEWIDGVGDLVWKSDGITEKQAGELVVKHLLAGNRGHFGPLEHPQIVLNVGWFPHSTMQQIRTHRVGVSFDVQSFRYTGNRLLEAAKKLGDPPSVGGMQAARAGKEIIEEVFYLRPVGAYTDRSGKHYDYTEQRRIIHLWQCMNALFQYQDDIEYGLSEEHARGMIPFDVRQHWVMSLNVRSLMHLLDLRWKKDAQLECQQLCELIFPFFQGWCPEIAAWYLENRAGKARLSP